MDYELARQLKDAGLPQEGLGFFAAENRAVGSRQHSDAFLCCEPFGTHRGKRRQLLIACAPSGPGGGGALAGLLPRVKAGFGGDGC